jgi:hypothetical protein
MVVVDGKAQHVGLDASVDAALVMREMHGRVAGGTLEAWLAEVRRALKPKGILGIEEHRAKPDADPVESAKKGYLPEKWLIERATQRQPMPRHPNGRRRPRPYRKVRPGCSTRVGKTAPTPGASAEGPPAPNGPTRT